ncbi:cytoplasmic dynein 2 heavy chain 1-like [Dermacentor variabilis]|uniref:cytoplasmic dynein 2 heavy chain 1-like n=1 Tax=Dermacentor variabilis TaxID=34621 RepID=UPI003F5C9415
MCPCNSHILRRNVRLHSSGYIASAAAAGTASRARLVSGRGLAARLETLLRDLDPWRAPLNKVQQELGQALSACGRSPSADAVLGGRLRATLQARLAQEQLVRLAPPTAREPLPPAPRLSDPEPEWRAAVELHTQWMAPLAARAAAALRERLLRSTGLPLLQECKSYSELLKHPDVQAQLAPEREMLLRALSESVVEAKKSYEQASSSIQGIPEVVRDIVGLQELRTRLEEAQEVVSLLNDGSESWEPLVQNLNRARDEAREAAADRLDAWSRSAQQIATKTSLQEDEPALVLGAGGRPRVSLSPRLASIAAEARQLRALGCRLPPGPLRQLEDTAARLGHRARHLQQVASFYSTVADQMIPSQRPLMLGLAEELTGALRQRVPWGDAAALDAFVGRLRALAARLAGRNRHLRALHLAVCRKVPFSLLHT